ncbi:class I SAM-dependent methyltransferase [Candidatus Berkelbacteria bacterium]|nr:class I SAM-dependent methyltransferase [Candidatus Berkelbacteria bacterium]
MATPSPVAWAGEVLRCPQCGAVLPPEELNQLTDPERARGQATCRTCGLTLTSSFGVLLPIAPLPEAAEAELAGIASFDAHTAGIQPGSPHFQQALLTLPDLPSGELGQEHAYGWKVALGHRGFTQLVTSLGQTPLRVLDIGADWCWSTARLARAGHHGVAIDINQDHLRHAAFFFDHGPAFLRVQADMNQLPFAPEIFDVVFAVAAVHHTTDLGHTLKEFARVLRPGGRLVLFREPVRGSQVAEARFGHQEKEVGIHETAPTFAQWRAALDEAGFTWQSNVTQLQFTVARQTPRLMARNLKRWLLGVPLLGSAVSPWTITDRTYRGTKRG